MSQSPTQPPSDAPRFESECQRAVSELRAALIGLYDSAGVDPQAPQQVSRRFSVNKTLAWTLARLMQEPEGLAAAALVPGLGSLTKVVDAAASCGADESSQQRVRSAALEFEHVAEAHVGDRASLELFLDSMGVSGDDPLEVSRRLAFRGNSGVYGVQARARVMCAFLLPGATDEFLDLAMISGYSGFRRLRATPRWPLFKVRSWGGPSDSIATARWRPVAGALDNGLLPSHCRGYAASINEDVKPDGSEYVLEPGPVGNTGAFDLFRAEALEGGASRYADEGVNGDSGELGVNITTPVEYLLLDLVAHESLDFALRAETQVFSRIFSQGEPSEGSTIERLPMRYPPALLSGRPPAFATTVAPGYAEVVSSVAERIGCDLPSCRAMRVLMRYPPLGSTVSLRLPLPSRG